MEDSTAMSRLRLLLCLGSLLLLAMFTPVRSVAQAPVDPGKLPGRTMGYLFWHGTPIGDMRKGNSALALWDDPQFAQARDSFLDSFLNDTNRSNKLSRGDLEQYVCLLDNPFLIGYLRESELHASAKTPAPANTKAPAWNGIFLIYDRSGKEQLLSKAVMQMRGADKDIPKLTEVTIAGVPALKVERKSGITYWAEFSKYAVSAEQFPVFEEILNMLNGKLNGSTLSESPAYQEAKPLLKGGVLEFYAGIPGSEQIAAGSPASATAQIQLLLSSLKLNAIHSIAGRVSFEGTRSRMTGAILGDTAPGSLFDIWAEGQANPVSMSYLSSDTVHYGEAQFNLLGIYDTLKRAFTPAGSAQTVSPMEQMAVTRIGMPLTDALGVVTGEVAWLQTSPVLDDAQKVYLLGIRNKPNALKLMRTLMGEQITSERNEGNATYLKISLHGGHTTAGVANWNFYYLAMTPNLLFGATRSDTLHKYVAQAPAAPDAGHFQNLLAARSQFPEKLDGFSYFDFQKLDWAGLKTKWVEEAHKAAQAAKGTDATKNNNKLADWLSQVDPEVFSRHLHSMTGASWKDAKGVHFDEWLD
jgi:hypothetical protein